MAKSATVELKVLAEATDAIKDIRKVEGSLDELEAAAKAVGDGATGIDQLTASMQGLSEASEGASKAGGGLSEAFAGGLAGGAVVAGLGALQSIVTDGFSRIAKAASDTFFKALDFNTGRIQLQAQLGLSAQDAKKFGQLSGDLYSEAYGESIDQVNEALGLVTRTLHLNVNTQRSDLKGITGDVLNLSQVFGVDLEKSVIAVGQLMKTGLAKNATEATDILTKGLQVAGQDADDLLDTLVEYPTNFRRLGLSGEQAMALINQGLKAGARNSDQVADSLKEFSLRIVDGSKKTSDALKTIGLDSADIPKKIATGGDQAREAFSQVVEAIKQIEDPAKRLIAITDLFGTPAEDMAAAWDALDLNHAVEEMGKVEGAAKQLGDTVASDPVAKFESFKRTIETNVVRFLADNVIPALEGLAPKAQEALAQFSQAWEGFKSGFTGEAPVSGSITALENMGAPSGTFQEFKDFGEEVRRLADEWLPRLKQALQDVKDQLSDLTTFAKENKEAFKLLADVVLFLAQSLMFNLMVAIFLIQGALRLLQGSLTLTRFAADLLSEGWSIVWGEMVRVARWARDNIIQPVIELWDSLRDLWNFVTGLFEDGITGAWREIERVINGVINRLSGPLRNFLDLVRAVLPSVPFLPGFNSTRSVAPVGPAVGLMAAPSTTSSPTVINVSVSHTGLGVDSPALQRDLVRTLQRYVQREGPIRVRTAS